MVATRICVLCVWLVALAGGSAWGDAPMARMLDSGVRVIVDRASSDADADAAVWLVLERGSMHEREGQRGAALVAARALMTHLAEENPASGPPSGSTPRRRARAGASRSMRGTRRS